MVGLLRFREFRESDCNEIRRVDGSRSLTRVASKEPGFPVRDRYSHWLRSIESGPRCLSGSESALPAAVTGSLIMSYVRRIIKIRHRASRPDPCWVRAEILELSDSRFLTTLPGRFTDPGQDDSLARSQRSSPLMSDPIRSETSGPAGRGSDGDEARTGGVRAGTRRVPCPSGP